MFDFLIGIGATILAVLAILYSLFSYLAIKQQQAMGLERRRISFTVAFIASTLFDALAVFSIVFGSISIALVLLSVSLALSLYGCYTRLKMVTSLASIPEKGKKRERK